MYIKYYLSQELQPTPLLSCMDAARQARQFPHDCSLQGCLLVGRRFPVSHQRQCFTPRRYSVRSSQHNERIKSGLEKLCLKLFGLGIVHDIPLIIACCIEIEFFAETDPGLIREGDVRHEEVRVDI